MPQTKLNNIKQQIENGVVPPSEIVSDFLKWFDVSKRTSGAVSRIREHLEEAELETAPDFESAYFHGAISFVRAGSVPANLQEMSRVGQLGSANRPPVSISPDKPICEAVMLMLTHEYSQLPVMTSSREVRGAVSWKTIGSKLALKQSCDYVRDCMEKARVVSIEESLFSVMNDISEYGYVLVQAEDRTICGIVTAADFSEQFRKLGEPFVLIGEIEHSIRKLIRGKFTASELADVKNPDDEQREVGGVSDLTFGEYVRLLQCKERWEKIGLALDRSEFVKRLDEIRMIRNDTMHFEPEGIPDENMKKLRDFSKFLSGLHRILS